MIDLYILDEKFIPVHIVENFISLIWDERFSEPGVLELQVKLTKENRDLFRVGTYLGMNNTPRIMVITEVEIETNEDDSRIISITGAGLESILDFRIARHDFLMLVEDETWEIKDKTPSEIMRKVFKDICVNGILSKNDIIPYLSKNKGTFYPADTNDEPGIPITIGFEAQSVLSVFKEITESYPALGFRIYRDMVYDSVLYFDVYTGRDRTSLSAEERPIVFSLPWGTLDSTTELDSIVDYANVAYVFSKYGTAKVNDNYKGFDRKVIVVKVTDQVSDNLRGGALTSYLEAKGLEELEKHRRVALFDGEIPKNIPYQYNVDYTLGDTVELIGDDNIGARMRIVGNTMIIDKEGYRSYPTFQMIDHIQPDTWSGLIDGQVWSTMPGTWNTY